MAEGWATKLRPDVFTAYSAGVETHGLNPRAVAVMREAGVDISGNASKLVAELPKGIEFEYVVTVCGNAHETCPFFPARSKVVHVGFDDPPSLTENMDDEQAVLDVYRRVRDEIRGFVLTLPDSLAGD
jgi:arsenate reductase